MASRAIIASKGDRTSPGSGIVKAGKDGLFEDEFYAGRNRYGHQGADYAEQGAADDYGQVR